MKSLLAFCLVLCLPQLTSGQNKTFAVGTSSPNPNAALQIDAPAGNQGVLIPRLTTAQRTAMTLGSVDKGLIVFDTDLNLTHTWNGTSWGSSANAGTALKLSTPMLDIIPSATLNSTLLTWRYIGSTSANLARFENLNGTNADTTLVVYSNGLGENAHFKVDNPASTSSTLYSSSNSLGASIASINSNPTTGTSGLFENTSLTNSGSTLATYHSGTGNPLRAHIRNTSSTASTIFASTAGLGRVGQFQINNPSNTNAAIRGFTDGLGSAGYFTVNNTAGGTALWVESNSNQFPGGTIYGLMTGSGDCAGCFRINNTASTRVAMYSETNGVGAAVMGNNIGTSGSGGYFLINQATNPSAAVVGETNGTGAAIQGSTSTGFAAIFGARTGTTNGHAARFETSGTNTFPTVSAETTSQNTVLDVKINNAANPNAVIFATTNGTGTGAFFQITNALSANPAVFAENNGTGVGVEGRNIGTGSGGFFTIQNGANPSAALFGGTNGTGAAIQGETTTGFAAVFARQTNASGIKSAVIGLHNGTGQGHAGLFQNTNAANNYPAVQVETSGTNSTAFIVSHNGTGGELATFQNNFVNAARIDRAGRGFFNNGTQLGGADLAELFDVEGSKESYEPGDVLVISESTDRTVEKSATPNSTKVAGVFATKPGVILTEKDINESTDQLVPMGVVGVIPTKVCLENGAIKRGDLLVTSSIPGHAMKAISKNGDGVFPAGTVIGKALENFDGVSVTGLIKVLVNVK